MNFLRKHIRFAAVFLLVMVFAGQFLFLGITYSPDTVRFEEFSEEVYPLYPSVLYFFRTLFGTELGYNLLGLFQNLLLALAIFSLVDYLRKTYCLDDFSFLASVLVSAAVFLAQKWFTRKGILSSNTLFSEALSLPFYLLFFRYALEAFQERKRKAFCLSCVFALCLILTRGQLYWVLVIIFINGLRASGSDRRKAFLSGVLACAVLAGCVQGARYVQTSSVRDTQSKSPVGFFLLSTAVYCSEKEDAGLFPEASGERRLFDAARTFMDDPQNLAAFSYETGDLTSRQKKFESGYDPLKSVLRTEYAALTEEGGHASVGKMTRMLIFRNFGAFLLHCVQNTATALIRTVAILRPVVNALAGVFLALMLLAAVILGRDPRFLKETQFVTLGLLCVFLNALIMAPGVFALSRYVFYNMPVLYLAAMILFRSVVLQWAGKFGNKDKQ